MEDNKASFNMAVATLARLDNILRQMQIVSASTNGIEEQVLLIKLLRNFLTNAIPLMKKRLDPKEIEAYRKRVFELRVTKRKAPLGNRYQYIDNPLLVQKIYDCVMDIQLSMDEFFMPPKREEDDDEY